VLLVAALLVSGCTVDGGGSPGGGANPDDGSCDGAFAWAAAIPPSQATVADLDAAVRRCRSLDDWASAAAAHPAALRGQTAEQHLLGRCTDAQAHLSGYQVCGLLRIAMATPGPTPKATKKPKATPKPTPRKTPRPTPRRTPRPTAKPRVRFEKALCPALNTYLVVKQEQIDRQDDLDTFEALGRLPSNVLARRMVRVASRLDAQVARWRGLPRFAPARTYISQRVEELRYSAQALRAFAKYARRPVEATYRRASVLREAAYRYQTGAVDEYGRLRDSGTLRGC